MKVWENVKEIFQYQSLFYVFKIIFFKVIRQYYNNFFAKHLRINKIRRLVDKKYYLLTFYKDIKAYVKSYVPQTI